MLWGFRIWPQSCLRLPPDKRQQLGPGKTGDERDMLHRYLRIISPCWAFEQEAICIAENVDLVIVHSVSWPWIITGISQHRTVQNSGCRSLWRLHTLIQENADLAER